VFVDDVSGPLDRVFVPLLQVVQEIPPNSKHNSNNMCHHQWQETIQ